MWWKTHGMEVVSRAGIRGRPGNPRQLAGTPVSDGNGSYARYQRKGARLIGRSDSVSLAGPAFVGMSGSRDREVQFGNTAVNNVRPVEVEIRSACLSKASVVNCCTLPSESTVLPARSWWPN